MLGGSVTATLATTASDDGRFARLELVGRAHPLGDQTRAAAAAARCRVGRENHHGPLTLVATDVVIAAAGGAWAERVHAEAAATTTRASGADRAGGLRRRGGSSNDFKSSVLVAEVVSCMTEHLLDRYCTGRRRSKKVTYFHLGHRRLKNGESGQQQQQNRGDDQRRHHEQRRQQEQQQRR